MARAHEVVRRDPVRRAVYLACLCMPVISVGQTAPVTGAQSSESLEQRMQRLEQRQQQLEQEIKQKDAEIQALKKQQPGAATPSSQPVQPAGDTCR